MIRAKSKIIPFSNETNENDEEIKESSPFIVLVWHLCRINGLMPFSLRRTKEEGRNVWIASYSSYWAVYSWAVLTLSVFFNLYGMYEMSNNPRLKRYIGVVVAIMMNIVLMIVTMLVCIARCTINARSLIKARVLVQKAQSVIVWGKKANKIDNRRYKLMTGFFLFFWIANILIGTFMGRIPGVMKPLLCDWFYSGAHAVMYCIVTHVTNGIYSLTCVLLQVNHNLKLITEDLQNKTNVKGDLRAKLSSVMEARHLIGEAGYILSQTHSPALLLILVSVITRSILYFFIVITLASRPGILPNIIFQASSCIGEVFKVTSVIETCHWMSQISDKTTEDINDMLSSIWDFGLRADMKFCLRQIREQPIEFTALDIWKVDRSLIGTVFGLIVTNAIVLTQFAGTG